MELSCLKNKTLLEKCLIFREMELSSYQLKKILIFQGKLPKPEKQKFHIFYLLRENFSNKSTKENVSYTFP